MKESSTIPSTGGLEFVGPVAVIDWLKFNVRHQRGICVHCNREQSKLTPASVTKEAKYQSILTMFAKPFQTSKSSVIKNKDVKKLKQDILAMYAPHMTEAMWNQLFPEGKKTQLKKVKCQAPSRVVLYVVEPTNEPLFFNPGFNDHEIFPTVYCLWILPQMLPCLEINANTSEYLLNGADLMFPGLVRSTTDELRAFQRGQPRGVRVVGNPMPVAIGTLAMTGNTIFNDPSFVGKGKVLEVMHIVHDELWKLGSELIPNTGFEPDRVSPVATSEDTGLNSIEEEKDLEEKDLEEKDLEEMKSSTGTTSVADMDALIKQTFLMTLRTKVKLSDLPMLSNQFYAHYMLPARPFESDIQIKKSSYKKLSKFLQAMVKEELITLTTAKGVESITAMATRDHPAWRDFVRYKTQADGDQEAQEAQAGPTPIFGVPKAQGHYAPQLLHLYKPSHYQHPIFGQDSKVYYTVSQVREGLFHYIEQHELSDSRDPRIVTLDPMLTDALFKGKKKLSGGYPTTLLKQEIATTFLDRCLKHHAIKLHPDHKPSVVKGDVKNIQIKVERRMGNKKVTCITYLEQFGIDLATFAKDAQKQFACSTTTQESVSHSGVEEVVIQGQCADDLEKYLDQHYKIHSKFISTTYGKGVSKKKKK